MTTMQKFLQHVDLDYHWFAGHNGQIRHEELGISDVELSATFAFPMFRNSATPLLVSPGFAAHYWEGPMSIQPTVPTDLSALTAELAAQMAPLALEAGRTIALFGTEPPARMNAHPEALRRALRNLLENANQHEPVGSAVEVEVTAAPAIHVRDRGPGIPAADRARVTERHWRADRNRQSGAGLGLNIVDRIARAEGGRLIIADRPGGGADIALSFGG